MWYTKLILVALILLPYSMLSMVEAEIIIPPPPISNMACSLLYKCSNEEIIVWATDGASCFVLRNSCYLGYQNCMRENRREEALRITPKWNCQKLCGEFCPQDYRPICAVYNGMERTFSNECALYNHICISGQTYNLRSQGMCINEKKELFYK